MRRIVWFGGWLSACCLAMLTPGTAFPDVSVVSFQDKIIHFIIFFVLAYRMWFDKASCCGLWLTAGYFVCALSARGGGHRGCSRTSV